MEEDKTILKERVLTQVLHLDAKLCGIVTGLLCGVGLFLATNLLVLKGGVQVGKHLSLLNQYFPGYRVTFAGSLIGFAYASVTGFGGGYFVARMYNWIASVRERKAQGHA
jgi:hypothetical protein